MRCHRQSVTMIVTTKATRMRSWSASSASISGPAPLLRTKGRRSPSRRAPPFPHICALRLGEVVADVAEDVLDLTAEEDHRDDDGDGDDSDDEGILDQALAVILAEEALNAHGRPPFSAQPRRRSFSSQVGKRY